MFVAGVRGAVLLIALLSIGGLAATGADAAQISQDFRVPMDDGVTLQATLSGESPIGRRPVIVEFSPYGPGSITTADGPAYNYVLVQDRGTGDSDGQFDALGPRSQQDMAEVLQWACHQPWSNGRLGLNGFSASAISVYNALHLKLPCVQTAVLRSGTYELYRDLLWPGGVSNAIPGLGVLGLIGEPAVQEGPNRLLRAPLTSFDTAIGLTDAGLQAGQEHQTLDDWWQQRGFRGEVNHLPILMLDSFFDVESRGAFQAYQELRPDGAHLAVVGAHDGAPAGTDDGDGAMKAWFDHYLLGIDNGIDAQPRVQMFLSDGSREGYLAGDFVRYNARDWPVPGTRWLSLWLSPAHSGTGDSINDGSLVDLRPPERTTQSYAAIPTLPSNSDQPNTAIVGPDGVNQAATAFPILTETSLSEPEALTYTTAPLSVDTLSAGPATLDLSLATSASETAMWAVIADVWPDGTSHPVATGRLLSAYPNVIRSKSLIDRHGEIVQPYGDFSQKSDAPVGTQRSYQIEFWPIGNRFRKGHRIRLIVLGASAASLPSAPALNTIVLGGAAASRLLLPLLPAPSPGLSCPPARGRLRGVTLGPLRLGMPRARARRRLTRWSARGRADVDFYCLTPIGIRAGYPSRAVLQALPSGQRRRVAGRVIWISTANPRYSLRGIRAGSALLNARRALHLGRGFHVGLNWWYFARYGRSNGLLKIRHRIVEEVGIADPALTRSRRAQLRFLESFS
jgi:putative CocE/NonD family hydrolase